IAAPRAAYNSYFFTADNAYLGCSFLEGTSFAAPYVCGALALVLSRFPSEPYSVADHRLLDGVDPLPALAGRCLTGGRLNLRKVLSTPLRLNVAGTSGALLQMQLSAGPNRRCVIESTTDFAAWLPFYTNTTSITGTFT